MNWKKFFKISFLFSSTFLILGFIYSYHIPKVKSWFLIEVEKQSDQHLPLKLWPESLTLNVFPVGVSVYNVRMTPKPPFHETLAPTVLKQVNINLNLWSLIRGKFKISQIKIIDSTLKYTHKNSSKSKIDFKILEDLPLNRVTLENIDIYAKDKKNNLLLYIDSLNLDVKIASQSLLTTIETPRISLKKPDLFPILNLGAFMEMRLSEKRIQIISAQLTRDRSFLIASGELTGNFTQAQYNSLDITTRGNINLKDLNPLTQEVFPKKKIPILNGKVDFDIQVQHKKGQEPQLNIDLQSKNTYIDGFEVGRLRIKGDNTEEGFEASLFEAENSGAKTRIDRLKIKLKDNYSFVGDVHISQFELRKFLKTLKIKKVPLHVGLHGTLLCKGEAQPQFKLNCDSDLKSPLIHVYNRSKNRSSPFTIIKLNDFYAKGNFQVSHEEVKYKAHVGFPEAQGQSDGVIHFKKGFHINYKGEIKKFSQIEDLAHLELKGAAKLKGYTKGNSRQATFNIFVQGRRAFIKEWPLGNTQFHIKYVKGILKLNKIVGNIHSTRYNGSISLNLPKKQIFSAIKSPFFEADIFNQVFKKRFNFNPNFHGTGTARLKLWGPFNSSQLNYRLQSKAHQGSLYGESFDQFTFNISAKRGKIKADRILIKKKNSSLSVTGFVQPKGNIDAKLQGRQIAIEQLDSLENIGLNLAGQLDFDSHFSGSLDSPITNARGTISRVVIEDRPVKNSSFRIKIDEKRISGQAQFTDGVIDSKFNIPLSKREPFSLSIHTKGWNFARFFSIFSKSFEEKNFDSKMTGELILNAKRGGPWKSSGHGTISEFEIRRGPISMSAKKPMKMLFSKGSMKTEDFKITGENTFLEMKSQKSTYKKLGLSIDGIIEISLAILLTPFLDELKGRLSLSTQVLGPLDDFNLRGSADLKEGLVQIKNFPHPLEKVSADLLFSKKSLLINALKARLAGGNVQAWGQASLIGINNVTIDVQAQFHDISTNVPEGVKTKGNGNVRLHGKKFPYTLSGQYTITKGDVTKPLGFPSGDSKREIKPSVFLPEFMNKAKLKPIDINFDVYIKEPLNIKTRINTSDIEAKVNGNIKILGPYDKIRLRGKLEAQDGGKVSFRANTFDIKTGRITYKDTSPKDPILLISANTRVEGTDIHLLAQGKATSPKIHLNSHPPMPEHEIVSLLVFGFTSVTSDHLGQTGLEEENKKRSTFQAASAILNEQLGITRGLNDQLGVRVDISSSYDKTQGTTIPSVTARKQWTPDFGASISRTIGNTTPTNLLRTEYRFNKNISVIGSFEQKESETIETDKQDSDILGLDLEYKVEFK